MKPRMNHMIIRKPSHWEKLLAVVIGLSLGILISTAANADLDKAIASAEAGDVKKVQVNNTIKLYSAGKNEFVLGNYEKAITLFISFAKNSPDSSNIIDSKLWLARSYAANEDYLKSKDAFLDYQSNNKEHSKYADSMFELTRVLIKLNEANENVNVYE